jgi:hypothetical protein
MQRTKASERVPARDLCPVLRSMRIRIERRLGVVDAHILALAQPAGRDDMKQVPLQRERAALVEALELIATASERGLEREARRRWLETLLGSAPACVTKKARHRLHLLIEGLRDSTASAE